MAVRTPPAPLERELFAQLGEPFTGEALFDRLPDLVFFVKNARGEYVVVNQTLVERCGRRDKSEVIGRRADDLFPAPLGAIYRAQDEGVLRNGTAIRDQLELHFYASGGRGWCLTNKMPLRTPDRRVVGIVGISRDLPNGALPIGTARGAGYGDVAGAVRHIQRHFDEPLRVKELAARAGLSRYRFEQRIRRLFQLTAGQLIQKTRLEAAVERLRETDHAIAAIAQDCGYSDHSAFTRQFRQTLGMSPTDYRRTRAGAPPRRS